MNCRRFEGKVAWITGGARGIGFAVGTRLISEGAYVMLADLDGAAAESAAQSLGPNAMGMALDVRDFSQHQAVVKHILERWGQLDILVTSAGIAGRSAPAWDITPEEWLEVLAVDLTGAFYAAKAALEPMRQRRSGHIVHISSVAGKEGNPNAVPYSAAKAGVLGLTKSMAKEVATEGIYINAVTPAVVATEILNQVSPAHVQYMVSRIPMGRVGKPEEVAALVAWACSDECSFTTGAVFDLSGGRTTY